MYNSNIIFFKKPKKKFFIKKKNLFFWKTGKTFQFIKPKINTPNLVFLNIHIKSKLKPFFLLSKYFFEYKIHRLRKLKRIQY